MPRSSWIPLEANPAVLSEFAAQIGARAIPGTYAFCDVFGLDEELLAMVPPPVLAVMLCFPVTSETDAAAAKVDSERALPEPQACPYYMKQTIGNACGTIALLHAIAANQGELNIDPGSFLGKFYAATAGLSPQARGAYLESPPEDAPDLQEAHQAAGEKGDTKPPAADEDVNLHFVAFVEHQGQLWELDGRRAGPLCHGPSSRESLLADVARVTRDDFMARTSSLNFNLIALARAEEEGQ